jgi:CRISPR-associated protein Csx17
MAGHVLELRGCTPEPLGNYLKALGVFRLIGEQADPSARAWWKGGYLHILQGKWEPLPESTGAEDQLGDWLLNQCRFTPLIAPWQKGTGYLAIGKRRAGADALTDLLQAEQPGTESFRVVFRDFAASLGVTVGEDPSKWLEEMKQCNAELPDTHLLRVLRNRVRPTSALKWLDVVGMSLPQSEDSGSTSWFPIVASGGGEASGQYVVNHQQRLKAVLLDDDSASRLRLRSSLRGENQPGSLEADSMGAMYYPSLMEAPNVGQTFASEPKRRVNPWDFILLLEGTLVWAMAASRRQGVTSERASFPFYCRSSFGGSATIGPKEVEGAEQSIANGELWCPVWTRPSSLAEIQRIFAEGRLQIGERVCSRSLDFALAMKGFGLDRGIEAFHRYSLVERSGSGRQTTLLAVPNGCFVPDRSASMSLLGDLREFADDIAVNVVDSSQQQRRLMLARVEFERAWFAATSSAVAGDSESLAPMLADLLISVGRLMRELGTSTTKPGIVKIRRGGKTAEKRVSPVGPFSHGWLEALGTANRTSVFRLARASAGIAAWGESTAYGQAQPAVESLRANLLPVTRQGKYWNWDDKTRSSVWVRGAPVEVNLGATLRRRLIEAQRGEGDGLPLWSPYGATFEDLLAFWHGNIDEERLTDLIHALSLIDHGTWKQESVEEPTPNLQTGSVWFDSNDQPKVRWEPIQWRGTTWLSKDELQAAFALPRVYHLLKLCFAGGRLPRRPVEGRMVEPTGEEPFPACCLDVLSLVEAGRVPEAAQIAARRLRAKGYPTLLRDPDSQALELDRTQARRLAGMLLIPVWHPGVLAALAIKPASSTS